ncbi:MAG: hypothetical protein WC972_13300 [Trueperaceae bacterium]
MTDARPTVGTGNGGRRVRLVALLALVGMLLGVALAQGDAASSQASFPKGIVGEVDLGPDHGIVGSHATLTGSGFDAGAQLQVFWGAFKGKWKLEMKDGEYTGTFSGREFEENDVLLTTAQVGADGTFAADFTVPEGFGGTHDVYVREDGVNVNKAGFRVEMSASMTPESGPVGSDITLTVTGLDILNNVAGWYAVMYDNAITGFVTAVETQGTATVTIPAAGRVGKHLVQLRNAPFNSPYLALASSPYAYLPEPKFTFTVTDGEPVMPPDMKTQGPATIAGTEPTGGGPAIWTDPVSSGVFTEGHVHGKGFAPNTALDLAFTNMAGSRVTLAGYGAAMVKVGQVTTDASGAFTLPFETPDVLGGEHRLEASTGGEVLATTLFNITPIVISLDPAEGPFGTDIMLHMKGVGWTQTDNIFAVVIDNVYFGYACGFSTNGDVKVPFTASWAPGWHVIDLYPSFYRNKDYGAADEQPFLYRQAILTWKDHPNQIHFRFMFHVPE